MSELELSSADMLKQMMSMLQSVQQDVAGVKSEISSMRIDFDGKLESQRQEFDDRFSDMKSEMKDHESDMRQELADREQVQSAMLMSVSQHLANRNVQDTEGVENVEILEGSSSLDLSQTNCRDELNTSQRNGSQRNDVGTLENSVSRQPFDQSSSDKRIEHISRSDMTSRTNDKQGRSRSVPRICGENSTLSSVVQTDRSDGLTPDMQSLLHKKNESKQCSMGRRPNANDIPDPPRYDQYQNHSLLNSNSDTSTRSSNVAPDVTSNHATNLPEFGDRWNNSHMHGQWPPPHANSMKPSMANASRPNMQNEMNRNQMAPPPMCAPYGQNAYPNEFFSPKHHANFNNARFLPYGNVNTNSHNSLNAQIDASNGTLRQMYGVGDDPNSWYNPNYQPNPYQHYNDHSNQWNNNNSQQWRSPSGSSLAGQVGPTHNKHPLEDTHIRVKAFNAKEIDWLDFRDYFMQIAEKAHWSDNTKCAKLLAVIDNGLLSVTADLPRFYNFEQLIAKLDQVNGVEFARREASMKLANVKRKENESVAFYAQRVRRLVSHAYSNYPSEAKDEQARKAFIQGLPTKQGFRMKMKLKDFSSLDEAVQHGSHLDQVLKEERTFDNMRSVDIEDGNVSDDNDFISSNDVDSDICRKSFDRDGKNSNHYRKNNNHKGQFRSYDQNKHENRQFENEHKHKPRSNENRNKPCTNCGHTEPKPEIKTPQNSGCYLCGEIGHWADTCKMKETAVPSDVPKSKDLNC